MAEYYLSVRYSEVCHLANRHTIGDNTVYWSYCGKVRGPHKRITCSDVVPKGRRLCVVCSREQLRLKAVERRESC